MEKKSSKKDIDRLTIVVEDGHTTAEGEISDKELFTFLAGGFPQLWDSLVTQLGGGTRVILTMMLINKLERLCKKYGVNDDFDSDDD